MWYTLPYTITQTLSESDTVNHCNSSQSDTINHSLVRIYDFYPFCLAHSVHNHSVEYVNSSYLVRIYWSYDALCNQAVTDVITAVRINGRRFCRHFFPLDYNRVNGVLMTNDQTAKMTNYFTHLRALLFLLIHAEKGRHLWPRLVHKIAGGKTSYELSWKVKAMIRKKRRKIYIYIYIIFSSRSYIKCCRYELLHKEP